MSLAYSLPLEAVSHGEKAKKDHPCLQLREHLVDRDASEVHGEVANNLLSSDSA